MPGSEGRGLQSYAVSKLFEVFLLGLYGSICYQFANIRASVKVWGVEDSMVGIERQRL